MPSEDSINIETVQHPTLGPLKFPSDMPYEQRNQLIENLEAEHKATTGTGASQDFARFAPGEQSTSRAQPGMPGRIRLQEETTSPSNLRFPRFYGAPPDSPSVVSATANVFENSKPVETKPSSALDRIWPWQMKDSTMQPSKPEAGPPDAYRSPVNDDSLAARIGLRQPGMPDGVMNESSSSTKFPTPGGKSFANPATGGAHFMSHQQSRSTNLGEAMANVGTAAPAGGLGMQKATTGGQSNRPPENPKPILKGKVGRTEAGADNQPEDVKVIQQLLNAAIDSGELTGKKLVEDGKVTLQMLAMIDDYQNRYIRGVQPDRPKRPGTPAKIRLIDDKSSTLKQLRQNPFADPRWNQYDDIIKDVVGKFNKKFPNSGLDWRLAKAMLWQESGGPDRGIEWTTWPMQIGRRKADTAIQDVISGKNYTKLIATKKERADISDAFHNNRMTPELNIQAGIIYLLARKIASVKNVTDSPEEKRVIVQRGDTVSSLAEKLGTTEEQLYLDHRELAKNPNALRPGELVYHEAHSEPKTWSDDRTALHKYNSEKTNKNYADQVLKRYEAIQRRWPQ